MKKHAYLIMSLLVVISVLLPSSLQAGRRGDRSDDTTIEGGGGGGGGDGAHWIKTEEADPILSSQWIPYFDKGKKVMLIDKKMNYDNKKNLYYLKGRKIAEDYWWLINYSTYNGPKQRFGIVDFKVADSVQRMMDKHGAKAGIAVAGLEASLMAEFAKTSRFTLVERSKKTMGDILKEQDFGASGRVWKKSAPKIGRILGAQFLIDAVVNEYVPDASSWGAGAAGGGGGKKGFGLGALGFGKSNSWVTITFKIVDSESSVVIASVKRSGRVANFKFGMFGGGAKSSGGKAGAGGMGFSRKTKARMDRAIMGCMAKAVYEIINIPAIKNSKLRTNVVKTVKKGDTTLVVIAGGKNIGLKSGMIFNIMKRIEVVNEDTGEDLGDDVAALLGEVGGTDVNKGTIKLTKVAEKVSVGTLIKGDKKIDDNDLVIYTEEEKTAKATQ